eukprot:3966756-Amphidinium_carterae.1
MIEAASNLNVVSQVPPRQALTVSPLAGTDDAARGSDWDGRVIDEAMVDQELDEGEFCYDGEAGPAR